MGADEWKSFAASEPYYAVITDERFRGAPEQEILEEFFASGATDYDWIISAAKSIDPSFSPRSFLDYGCGVGRILLAAAERCEHVTGVDIAEPMLARAQRHATERALENVSLRNAADIGDERFDLVNCYLVLQHIPPAEGRLVFDRLVDAVKAKGFLSVHVLHSRPGSKLRRLGRTLRASSSLINRLANRARGTAGDYMQMNVYDLPPLFRRLQRSGFREARVRFTDHGGMEGVWIVAGPRVVEIELPASVVGSW